MHKLIVPMGVPASGKSTIMREVASLLGDSCKYFSRDDIRFALLQEDEDYFAHENEVTRIFFEDISKSLAENEYTIADATHLTTRSRAQLFSNLHYDGAYEVIGVWIDCDINTCIERNYNRIGRSKVPNNVIKNFFKSRRFPDRDTDGHWFDYVIVIDSSNTCPDDNAYFVANAI